MHLKYILKDVGHFVSSLNVIIPPYMAALTSCIVVFIWWEFTSDCVVSHNMSGLAPYLGYNTDYTQKLGC